jgi:hypothetical protein
MQGATIIANDNLAEGIIAFNGGSIESDAATTIVADSNVTGILVGTGASGLLFGTIDVASNTNGILSVAGKLVIFGDVTATNNGIGLLSTSNGTLRLQGTNTIELNNVFGVFVDGSYLQLLNASVVSNTFTDARLLFGAKADFGSALPAPPGTLSTVGTVFCDDSTKISVRGAACPP